MRSSSPSGACPRSDSTPEWFESSHSAPGSTVLYGHQRRPQLGVRVGPDWDGPVEGTPRLHDGPLKVRGSDLGLSHPHSHILNEPSAFSPTTNVKDIINTTTHNDSSALSG